MLPLPQLMLTQHHGVNTTHRPPGQEDRTFPPNSLCWLASLERAGRCGGRVGKRISMLHMVICPQRSERRHEVACGLLGGTCLKPGPTLPRYTSLLPATPAMRIMLPPVVLRRHTKATQVGPRRTHVQMQWRYVTAPRHTRGQVAPPGPRKSSPGALVR